MADVDDELHQARAAVDRRDWDDAHARLDALDRRAELAADDLERLALAAHLTGRHPTAEDAWIRAHRAHHRDGDLGRAVRCAFWLGFVLVTSLGDPVRGGGWLARAERLLDDSGATDGPEHGYLLLPTALGALDGGDPVLAHARFEEAARVGEREHEPDLVAFARLGQGQACIRMDQPGRGLALLDEVMITVEGGAVSPLAAGLVQCAGILACQHAFDLGRAQQWTTALTHWCDTQPGLVPFRGQCLVHRSELAQLRGDWDEAVSEADRACRWLTGSPDPAAGMAHYQRAELHRLRGEHDAAEAAFEAATACGHDPHPGLARLWLAQGRRDAAVAALRRAADAAAGPHAAVLDEVRAPRPRAELLAARVEVLLAAGDLDTAEGVCDGLEQDTAPVSSPYLTALTTRARGAVRLAQGRVAEALELLTTSRASWTRVHASYEAARTRALVARALEALGDAATAAIERRAARRTFEEIGAAHDLHDLDAASTEVAAPHAHGLTDREVEVLRLVAAGHTNREVAARLVISDKTVARHLHNVFTKLGLPNRSAATAWAYEHALV